MPDAARLELNFVRGQALAKREAITLALVFWYLWILDALLTYIALEVSYLGTPFGGVEFSPLLRMGGIGGMIAFKIVVGGLVTWCLLRIRPYWTAVSILFIVGGVVIWNLKSLFWGV